MKNYFFLFICFFSALPAAMAQTENVLEQHLRHHQVKTQLTPEGLHYLHERPGSGISPKDGDYVLIRYRAMLLDSTTFDKSEPGNPFIFQVGNREVIKGLDLGVRLMKNGGKAQFFIPASLGYQQYGIEDAVPPDSPLRYEVELLDVMNFNRYDRYIRDLEARERAAFEQQKKEQFQADIQLIEAYAASHRLQVKRTPSGLSYVITKQGKGETPKKGDRLKIHYEGYFLNGELFEQSEKPFEFVLGGARVIEGWEEGLQFFKKESEGWLLIPSQLAYGPLEVKNIPANSVLVFKIKLIDIQ